MQTLNRQRGMTLTGLVMLFAILALVVMVVLKLFPVYMQDFTIQRTLTSLNEDGSAYISANDVRDKITRRFSINDVTNVAPADVVISRTVSGYVIDVDYEVRVPFLFNIDFMISFDHQAEVGAR